MTNEYTPRWRAVFGDARGRTAADIEYLHDVLPLPDYRRILDVPCGDGRIRRALEPLGYKVIGVDSDPAVAPDVVADLRHLEKLPSDFDAVVNLWASFGYFGAVENERVLASLAGRLREEGRIVLDVYNREFFEGRDGERELHPGVIERSTLVGDRRRCEIRYADGATDHFEWQLYTPAELVRLAEANGLSVVDVDAAADRPSMRLAFERA